MVENLKNGHKVVGAKQTRRAVSDGSAQCVFLADNADPNVTQPIRLLCEEQKITVESVPDMKCLGEACGVKVATAAAALLKS